MSKATFCKSARFSRLVSLLAMLAMMVLWGGCDDGGDAGGSSNPPTLVGSSGAGSAAWIINQLTNGLTDYEKNKVQGWILSIFGGSQSDPNQDMIDAIDEMNAKLDIIINQLAAIKKELDSILTAIELSTDIIINIEQQLAIKTPQDTINNVFLNLQALDSSQLGTDGGKELATDLAKDILNTSRSNIDQQIYSIYSGIMGLATQSQGVLYTLTSTLVDKSGDGALLYRYEVLQSYFKSLLQVQLKGANLMIEALHHRDDPPPTLDRAGQMEPSEIGPGDYPNSAKDWMEKKFMPMLADEVEEFLRCTERVVLAECDLRTDASGISQGFLPNDADTIFSKADFIAAQISPSRHPFGLVVRLIGEPDTVNAIFSNYQVQANGEVMQPVQFSGNTEDVVYLVPVEKWNDWPDGATKKYMQWNWNTYSEDSPHNYDGFLEFTLANHIAVAGYALDTATEGASYAVDTTFPHEYATANVTAVLLDDNMETVTQEPPQEGDDPPPSHVWAHATLPIRHVQGGAVWFNQGESGYVDDYAGILRESNVEANRRPPRTGLQIIVYMQSPGNDSAKAWTKLRCGINNGTADSHKIGALVQAKYDMSCEFWTRHNWSSIQVYWTDYGDGTWTTWGVDWGGGWTDQQWIFKTFQPGEQHGIEMVSTLSIGGGIETRNWDETSQDAEFDITADCFWLFVMD